MRIVTLAIAMLLSSYALAQNSFSGYITENNNKALIGASVSLKGSKTHVTPTDIEGYFEFTNLPQGEYSLEVSYIGYLTAAQSVVIPHTTSLNISLEENFYLHDAVVVMATRAGKNAPLAYDEIDKKDLQELNMGKDMPYLLESLASVVTTSDGGTGVGYTGIRIRGSDATRINVTLNGIPYNDSESQGVYWVDLPDMASSVESIQVQRGVGSSTNGAGAFGGSINIQTSGLNEKAYATLDNAFGSFNTRKHTLSAGTGLINGAFTVDARVSKINTDGYLDRAYADLSSFYLSTGYHGKSSLLKFNMFSGHEITYQAWEGTPEARVNNDMQGMQNYVDRNFLNQKEADNLFNSGRTYNLYEYQNQVDDYTQTHYQLLFSQDIANDIILNTALHYTHGEGFYEQYKAGQKLSDYGFTGPTVGGVVVNDTDLIRRRWLDNDFYGLTFSGHYTPQRKLDLLLGGAWNTYDGDHYGEIIWAEISSNAKINDRYYDNTGTKNDFNIYSKASYDISNALTVFGDIQYRTISYKQIGIDSDQQTLNDDYQYQFINPKVGINYMLDNNASLYASYSVGNKEPSRSDFIDNSTGVTPKHETLNDYEIGFRKVGTKLQISTNLYFMDYNNQLVATGELNDVGAVLRTNVASSYRSGIEISGQYQLNKQFTVMANATFSQNIIKSFTEIIHDSGINWDQEDNQNNQIPIAHKQTDIAFSPNIIAGGSLKYQPITNLSISWAHRYVGDQYLDNTSNEKRKINSYYLSDLRANYSFSALKMKSIGINLAVYNLFNNLYESNGYTYGYKGGGNEIRENFFYPQAGVNFMVGISIKL